MQNHHHWHVHQYLGVGGMSVNVNVKRQTQITGLMKWNGDEAGDMAPFEVQAKNKRICNYFIAFRGYKKCSVGHKWDIR